MPGGQPKKYPLKQVTEGIERYFKKTDPEDYTMCGLALEIGFCERKQLNEYSKYPEYSPIVKAARMRIESGYEKRLHNTACTGSIFALKNMGWEDKSKVETQETNENLDDLKKEIAELMRVNDIS